MVKKKYNNRTLFLIFGFLFVSVILLFINERWITDEVLHNLIMTLAISGITTGIYSILSLIIEKENVVDVLESYFGIINKCNEYGLRDIKNNFPLDNEKIMADFIQSKEVYVLMNDGKNFFSSQYELLNKRFNEPEKETNIVLLDYEQEDTMSVLTRKNGHGDSPNYYKNKIKDVIDYHLKNQHQNSNKHILNIYLNSNYNTLAMIVTDNYAMISIFRVSSGKKEVPHFVFDSCGKEYNRIKEDVKAVCANSRKSD